MNGVFSGIEGQDRVVALLSAALAPGQLTHAYLLVGTAESNIEELALRFAAAVVAGGDAAELDTALRGAHPDLHLLEPAGAGAYLVAQVRELVADAELTPVRAAKKAYIVEDVDKLSGVPANALLKTLEEPPESVVYVLLSPSEDAVLETIRSRCEVVRLRGVVAGEPESEQVFRMMQRLCAPCGNRELFAIAEQLVVRSQEGVAALDERFEAELAAKDDFLSVPARKELEQAHKREVTAQARARLKADLAVIRSWLRDCLLVASGAPDLVAHSSQAQATLVVGTSAGEAALLDAVAAVDGCESRISYNVATQLAVEAMLIEIREAVCQ